MTAIAIRREDSAGETRFRAAAGDRQAVGRTMGEALDTLTAELGEGETADTYIVLRQGFHPDPFFTQPQRQRLQDLMEQWRQARDAGQTLSPEEQNELEILVNAELEAAGKRIAAQALLDPAA